jgi:hypothetical protein
MSDDSQVLQTSFSRGVEPLSSPSGSHDNHVYQTSSQGSRSGSQAPSLNNKPDFHAMIFHENQKRLKGEGELLESECDLLVLKRELVCAKMESIKNEIGMFAMHDNLIKGKMRVLEEELAEHDRTEPHQIAAIKRKYAKFYTTDKNLQPRLTMVAQQPLLSLREENPHQSALNGTHTISYHNP